MRRQRQRALARGAAGSIKLLHEKVRSSEPIDLDGAGLLNQILTRERNVARPILLMGIRSHPAARLRALLSGVLETGDREAAPLRSISDTSPITPAAQSTRH